jgi:shikimate kinase
VTVAEPAVAPTGLRRPVVLVGLMGSGKTTIGKKVASALGVPFADTDAEIERRSGRSIAAIFESDGEAAFRATEAATVAELVDTSPPGVVATGGGAVLDPATRARLRDRATVVWLRATPAVLVHRIASDGTRPLLADDPRAALVRLAAEREPLYREVADHVVDVDHVARKVVVAELLAALGAGGTGTVGDGAP